MAASASWFIDSLAGSEDTNPFEMPVEEVGRRIDLRDPKASLELRLDELIRREGNLFNVGVTCAIKDRPDTTCHACSACRIGQTEEALSALCRVGREQEQVLTELAVIECRDR